MEKVNAQRTLDNPHPLSTRKTELIWEGEYNEYRNRSDVDLVIRFAKEP